MFKLSKMKKIGLSDSSSGIRNVSLMKLKNPMPEPIKADVPVKQQSVGIGSMPKMVQIDTSQVQRMKDKSTDNFKISKMSIDGNISNKKQDNFETE